MLRQRGKRFAGLDFLNVGDLRVEVLLALLQPVER
jgi:hypothetical protein